MRKKGKPVLTNKGRNKNKFDVIVFGDIIAKYY